MRKRGFISVVALGAVGLIGCSSGSDGTTADTEAPVSTLSAEQLDYLDCVDTLTNAVMQMAIVGADHDTGFQSIVRAFGTESEEMRLTASLLEDTARQGLDDGVDATRAALSPKVQKGCADIHPAGVVDIAAPPTTELPSAKQAVDNCAAAVLGSLIDAFDRMTDGVDNGDGIAFADIFTTYGSDSVEYTVVTQLFSDFAQTGQAHGLDAALAATDPYAACAAGYGVDGSDAPARPSPASTDLTEAGSPTSEIVTDPADQPIVFDDSAADTPWWQRGYGDPPEFLAAALTTWETGAIPATYSDCALPGSLPSPADLGASGDVVLEEDPNGGWALRWPGPYAPFIRVLGRNDAMNDPSLNPVLAADPIESYADGTSLFITTDISLLARSEDACWIEWGISADAPQYAIRAFNSGLFYMASGGDDVGD